MNSSRHFLLLFILFIFHSLVHAATRIDLNDNWRFRLDPKEEGQNQGWSKSIPSGTEVVQIPHTWNIGKHDDYEGVAWYFREIEVPKALLGQHLEVHFGATFYRSRVWLNGVELGEHEGGHTAYFFDITRQARASNYLAIAIDNRPGLTTIPAWAMNLAGGGNIWADWWHYGGIVRDVWLTANEDVLIRRQQIRSHVQGDDADVSSRVYLENAGPRAERVRVTATALAPDGSSAGTETQIVNLRPGKTDVALTLKLAKPILWRIDQPNVYQMQVEASDEHGRRLDASTDTFGIRTIEIRDRHLLVNGDRVRLSGITRHEESPWEGLAETRGTMLHDYADMKSVHVTLTRPVHYPQNPYIFEFADHNGMLLIPEIPIWQVSKKQFADPKLLKLAKQMMREVIEQDGNHPSIFAWSVCNESATATPEGRQYFREMKALIRELDPERFVTFADQDLPHIEKAEDDAANDADFLMMNQYFGTWAGPAERLPEVLDKVDRLFPKKMVVISEFGAAGVFAKTPVEADRLRVDIIRSQMAQFEKRDWIAGAILWCYQDYKSHRNLAPGVTEGYVDMGIVDENYQRRPSYFVWKELNSAARIEAKFTGDWYGVRNGFSATIRQRSSGELPSYPLRGYRVHWELRDQDNTLVASGDRDLPNLERPEVVEGNWEAKSSLTSLKLAIRLISPAGLVAAEKDVDWMLPASGGQTIQQMQPNHLPY